MSLKGICCIDWSKQDKPPLLERAGSRNVEAVQCSRAGRNARLPPSPLTSRPSPAAPGTSKPPTFTPQTGFKKTSRDPPALHPTQLLLAEPKTRTLSYLETELVCICDCWFKGPVSPALLNPGQQISNTRLQKKRLCLAPPWPNAFAHPSLQNKSCSLPCAKIHL